VIYRDFPLLQATIILKSILILTINLGVDISMPMSIRASGWPDDGHH